MDFLLGTYFPAICVYVTEVVIVVEEVVVQVSSNTLGHFRFFHTSVSPLWLQLTVQILHAAALGELPNVS